jgi:hypothetical protein
MRWAQAERIDSDRVARLGKASSVAGHRSEALLAREVWYEVAGKKEWGKDKVGCIACSRTCGILGCGYNELDNKGEINIRGRNK